jgi:tetratricopeptide (TPR) repeat protein
MLASSKELYRQLIEAHPDVPQYRAERATTCFEVGELLRSAGRHDEAQKSLAESRDELQKLHDAYPRAELYRRLLGIACYTLGAIQWEQGRMKEAAAEFSVARRHFEALLAEHPDGSSYQLGLANALTYASTLHYGLGNWEKAAEACQGALAVVEKLSKGNPGLHQTDYLLATSAVNLGCVRLSQGRFDEALASLEKGEKAARKLAAEHPELSTYQYTYGLAGLSLAMTQITKGQFEEAAAHAEQARKTFAALVEGCPDAVVYRSGLACSHAVLARSWHYFGQSDRADKEAAVAMEELRALEKKHPEVVEFQEGLALACFVRATSGRTKEPEAHLDEAQRRLEKLAAAQPFRQDWQVLQALALLQRGGLLKRALKLDEALEAASKARKLCEKLLEKEPKNPLVRFALASTHLAAGKIYQDQKKPAAGVAELEKARDLLLGLREEKRLLPRQMRALAMVCVELGDARLARKEKKKAIADYSSARDAFAAALEADRDDVLRCRYDLAWLALLLGIYCGQEGMAKESEKNFELSRREARILNRDGKGTLDTKHLQAKACMELAERRAARKEFESALEALDEAAPLFEAVFEARPKDERLRKEYTTALHTRAAVLDFLKRFAEAVPDLDRLIKLLTDPQERWLARVLRANYLAKGGDRHGAAEAVQQIVRDKPAVEWYPDLAGVLSLAAEGLSGDRSRPLPEREKYSERWCREALVLLRKTAAKGLLDEGAVKLLKTHENFAFLNKRQDFQDWLKQLEK